ncbi:MAG: copper amine oxidase N-terminal domain-containing protein [Desulfotomaculaceae bacterium]
MKKWLAGVAVLVLLISCAAVAAANNPVKLIVNGREIKADVPPQMVNGRTMVPVRWVAEALGAEVRWDGGAVYIDSQALASVGSITPQQVARWIKEQGKSDPDSYYLDGLTYELANLDADEALELVAKIDGGVHLGQFFIFERDAKGTYQLITEQNYKVDSWDFDHPIKLAGENKRIFKLVIRDGGTGIDQFTTRFCYLEQGQFIEAWRGILLERSTMARDAYYKKTGGYQVDDQSKRLYAWETTHRLDRDGVTLLGELQTVTRVYNFKGTVFATHGEKITPGPK